MLSISAHHHSIKLARPFTISRGTRTHAELVRVIVRYQDLEAEGECTPYPRYGESIDSVISQITEFANALTSMTPNEARLNLQTFPAGAARNALDCALWALEAQLADGQFPSPLFNFDLSRGSVEVMIR